MAIKYTIKKFAKAFPSNALAGKYGEHLVNLVSEKDMQNGMVVARNEWQGMQYYDVKAATGVKAQIVEIAANGDYYLDIIDAGDGIFVYETPMIEEQYNDIFQNESNFYIPAGTRFRGYRMHEIDLYEVSKEAFTDPEKIPEVGSLVTVGDDYKWKASTTEGGNG